jgi:hypothetical protein
LGRLGDAGGSLADASEAEVGGIPETHHQQHARCRPEPLEAQALAGLALELPLLQSLQQGRAKAFLQHRFEGPLAPLNRPMARTSPLQLLAGVEVQRNSMGLA